MQYRDAVLVRGIHDDGAVFAGAFAFGAHAAFFLQYQMQNTAFARGHGVETEWRACLADAIRGDARGELQFFNSDGAVTAGVKANPIIKLGIEP